MMRIGQGFDVHLLVPGRELILCGVHIPHRCGLLGHSDADVAVHALMDAMLGALALGDIGSHFPDSDAAFAGADSMELLRRVCRLVADMPSGEWRMANCDITIVAEKPKIMPYREEMRRNIAAAVGCPLELVSVKATTTEKAGFAGREEGIAAMAVVLLEKKD